MHERIVMVMVMVMMMMMMMKMMMKMMKKMMMIIMMKAKPSKPQLMLMPIVFQVQKSAERADRQGWHGQSA